MICPQCNKEIEDNSEFCEFCGANVRNQVVAPPPHNEPIVISADDTVKKKPQPQALTGMIVGINSLGLIFAYGIFGLIGGIIGLIISSKGKRLYNENPSIYTDGSGKMAQAGIKTSIFAIIFSSIVVIGLIVLLIFVINEANSYNYNYDYDYDYGY